MKMILVSPVALLALLFAGSAYSQAPAPTATPKPEVSMQPSADYKEEESDINWPIKRRQAQVRTEPGYLVAPMAASIPGIGLFYGGLASYFNMMETEADFFGFRVWGELDGYGIGIIDIPLFWEPLALAVFYAEQAASIDVYDRGMDSKAADLRRLKVDRFNLALGQLSLRFFEKRLQFFLSLNRQITKGGEVLNSDGDTIAEMSDEAVTRINKAYGIVFDLTDDRSDPRKGAALEIQRYDRPDSKSYESDFYVMDYNLIGYIPIGKLNTWVFNAYRSDAIITRQGDINRKDVEKKLDISCDDVDSGDQENCADQREKIIDETIAENRHGTASSLGGTQRLRSFTTNRFYGAHAMHFGTEFRWNLTEEFTPFNYIVAGGVRSGLQLALFAEYGGVSDTVAELGEDMTYSIGGGFRLLIASGFVVRVDLATGPEGAQPSLIFSYPWNVF